MNYLVTADEMRQLDQQTESLFGLSGRLLLENAGRAVAQFCAHLLRDDSYGDDDPGGAGAALGVRARLVVPWRRTGGGAPVVVVCGKGNNGGDGLVAARVLAALGRQVRLFLCADATTLKADAAAAYRTLVAMHPGMVQGVYGAADLELFAAALPGAALIVDALFGTGLRAEVSGVEAEVIRLLNERPGRCEPGVGGGVGGAVPVVSVDIASGLHADTGAVLGCAVQADHTVTLGWPKRGQVLFPGASYSGWLHVAEIGLAPELPARLGFKTEVITAADVPLLWPTRRAESHKGDFGHVVVWAGATATPGAAILALQGALRAGAGLVSWAVDGATLEATKTPVPPEVMLRLAVSQSADAELLAEWAAAVVERATALVVGPGLGTGAAQAGRLAALFDAAKAAGRAMCVDADGLTLLAQDDTLWRRAPVPLVLTPHPKEMAALLKSSVAQVQADRVAAARFLAERRGCVVVLKGAGTVVADGTAAGSGHGAPGSCAVAVVAAGSASLATGGTGDVLAGMVGGLLAQGLPPYRAACAAALGHAVAGELAARDCGLAGTSASDVAHAVARVGAAWGR